MKERIIEFFKTNFLPFAFAIFAILVELTAVFVTSGKFYIRSPWMYFTILGILTAIQFFIPSNRARHLYSCIALAVLLALDLAFIIVYEMTGTIFDFSMLKLRGDAMAIIEKVPVNFLFFTVAGVLYSSFVVFGKQLVPLVSEPEVKKTVKIVIPCLLAALLGCHSTLVYFTARESDENEFIESKLYSKVDSAYSDKGIIGNLASELYQGAFYRTSSGDYTENRNFVYAASTRDDTGAVSDRFGMASGYNVVTILGESFEWFSFLRDETVYPFGHTASEQVLRELYPNLYAFYDSSVIMTNFHAREKTDISENLSLVGNYPLDYYLNYDYTTNNIAYSLPNLMKTLYDVDSISFHNGERTFYNRDEYLTQAAGFMKYVAAEDMEELGMTNYIPLGERNLDSDMIRYCADEMFPTDRRFNTYITTITPHGQFTYRHNLERHYETLDEKGVLPLLDGLDSASTNSNTFRYYAAAAMELDAAVGEIMRELNERGLTDNTLVAIFGDHNTYYQSLSNYVKDIYITAKPDKNVTELYRVPFMVKVGRGEESRVEIDKFTCTADILPTLLDLLGIYSYSNLQYGVSAFTDRESLLYSRAYDVFMTDKLYFSTLNNIKYSAPDVTSAYLAEIESRAKTLLEKIRFANRLFKDNFFRDDRLTEFKSRIRSLNDLGNT